MRTRIEQEKHTVEAMISLYCKRHHYSRNLCRECQDLLEYANDRLDNCKYGEQKTSCRKCPSHCYRKDMRENIKRVMRFSGPRMILYHPIMAIKHLIT